MVESIDRYGDGGRLGVVGAGERLPLCSASSADGVHVASTVTVASKNKPVLFSPRRLSKGQAIANPGRDYDQRLLARFDRDIPPIIKSSDLRRDALVELYVPEDGARWMKPGSEGNKLGYYRVLRSQLRYQDADGKEQRLEITSLISWRREWYVVHVHGFE